jgi:hypothetical protein
VEVKLGQSPWGLGILYDNLILSTAEGNRYTHQFAVNPCILLALVEGVLGYERVAVNNGQWIYRRDTAFRSG